MCLLAAVFVVLLFFADNLALVALATTLLTALRCAGAHSFAVSENAAATKIMEITTNAYYAYSNAFEIAIISTT